VFINDELNQTYFNVF